MTMTKEAKLIASMQAPPASPGAHTEFDGPRQPDLTAPPPPETPAVKCDRVEKIGAFGRMTGEVGTVLAADETKAVVKWDDDGRELLRQQYLEKLTADSGSVMVLCPRVPECVR